MLCRRCIDQADPPSGLGTLAHHAVLLRPDARAESCPHCGWTREKARETALFGCPLCYAVFPELLGDLFELHSSISDAGVAI